MKNLLLFIFATPFFLSCGSPKIKCDFLLVGGNVLDGSGEKAFSANIAISADTIMFIGNAEDKFQPGEIIDATGYTIAPGFIDPHTHATSDLSDSVKNANLNYLFQGVTTVVCGSDGNSVPLIGEQLDLWDEQGIGTNAILMTGHRTMRRLVMGMSDSIPNTQQMANMKKMVERGMKEGAYGFSSGLYYAPASFAKIEEVIELARVAAQYDGIYDVHIRDESSYNIGLIAAIEESIEICREADIHLNVSHIKCLGVDVWDQSDSVIALIEAAQAEGLSISADQYPYKASGTHLDRALLPKWVFAGDFDYTKKFDDPKQLPKIREGIIENLRRRGGPPSLLIVFSEVEEIIGKTLEEISNERGTDPIDTAIDIMKNGSAAVASFNMKEEDVHNYMAQPWVMTCSDGTNAHPRKYGSFPKKIREYVLEKKVLSLEEMVRKSTSLTAKSFGIEKRGKIKEGFYADLIIFKPEEIKDLATFEEPSILSQGMNYVFVNGQLAIREGQYTKTLPGVALRKK
ncbi:MAG: amidohydrolase family protein [Bacteroidota bacterium]